MAKKRLIEANEIYELFYKQVEYGATDLMDAFEDALEDAQTVYAVEVIHGHWKEYSHSALVRWKDGEPVWADRSVFRCSRCDFGTIARHNYCPRCGAKMDGGNEDA